MSLGIVKIRFCLLSPIASQIECIIEFSVNHLLNALISCVLLVLLEQHTYITQGDCIIFNAAKDGLRDPRHRYSICSRKQSHHSHHAEVLTVVNESIITNIALVCVKVEVGLLLNDE